MEAREDGRRAAENTDRTENKVVKIKGVILDKFLFIKGSDFKNKAVKGTRRVGERAQTFEIIFGVGESAAKDTKAKFFRINAKFLKGVTEEFLGFGGVKNSKVRGTADEFRMGA